MPGMRMSGILFLVWPSLFSEHYLFNARARAIKSLHTTAHNCTQTF